MQIKWLEPAIFHAFDLTSGLLKEQCFLSIYIVVHYRLLFYNTLKNININLRDINYFIKNNGSFQRI